MLHSKTKHSKLCKSSSGINKVGVGCVTYSNRHWHSTRRSIAKVAGGGKMDPIDNKSWTIHGLYRHLADGSRPRKSTRHTCQQNRSYRTLRSQIRGVEILGIIGQGIRFNPWIISTRPDGSNKCGWGQGQKNKLAMHVGYISVTRWNIVSSKVKGHQKLPKKPWEKWDSWRPGFSCEWWCVLKERREIQWTHDTCQEKLTMVGLPHKYSVLRPRMKCLVSSN